MKRVSELGLGNVVDPISEGREHEEDEAADPKGPRLPASKEQEADDQGGNAQSIDYPSILQRVGLE